MVDLERHTEILRAYLPTRLARFCAQRMLKGVEVYEQPGLVDKRDLLWEATEEVADAANYLAMEILNNGESEVKRRILASLCEAYRGISLLANRKESP